MNIRQNYGRMQLNKTLQTTLRTSNILFLFLFLYYFFLVFYFLSGQFRKIYINIYKHKIKNYEKLHK